MTTGFVRTYLPLQLEIIETSSITGLRAFVQELFQIREDTGQVPVGVVTGKAGNGKTVGGMACLENFRQNSYSLLPHWLWINVFQHLRKELLMRAILAQIEGAPLRKTGKLPTIKTIAEALVDNEIELIVVDEAENLNPACRTFIEELSDQSRTIFLFLGLPKLRQQISQSDWLTKAARIFDFKMPATEELMNEFLPQMKIPYWQFDPNREEDRELGQYLCKLEGMSLRKLRTTLQAASFIAETEGNTRINRVTVEKTIKFLF